MQFQFFYPISNIMSRKNDKIENKCIASSDFIILVHPCYKLNGKNANLGPLCHHQRLVFFSNPRHKVVCIPLKTMELWNQRLTFSYSFLVRKKIIKIITVGKLLETKKNICNQI